MKFGVITHTAVTCKGEASHKAEQINQLLFGDLYEVLETTPDWIKIKSAYDNYEGWIHKKHHTSIEKSEFLKLRKQKPKVSLATFARLNKYAHTGSTYMSIGSSLYNLKNGNFRIGEDEFIYRGKLASTKRSDIFTYAKLFLNTPYLWGGRTLMGIDCSGFMQMVHKLCGVQLPRDSWQQAMKGKTVPSIAKAKKGDLCFFGDGDRITHVGMLYSDNTIIHASGKVKIEKIDDQGIFNEETQSYTHKLKSIRRI